jgi:hypothetical protein
MPTILPDGNKVIQAPQVKLPPKTDGRRMGDWLKEFNDHTSEIDAPHNYLIFTGLATLAAVAQRKLFRHSQKGTLYPNLYVWLVGQPGIGKSVSLEAGLRLLRPLKQHGLYLASDAPSVPGLMLDFREIPQQDHQSLTAFISELSSFFANADQAMYEFLTEIYDGKPDYKKNTRVGGKEEIPHPCFNMIGATTPRWLGDNLDANAVEGGFVSRTLFLFSDQIILGKSEPEVSKEYLKRCDVLTNDLAQILTLHGEFQWEGGRDGDAFKYYDEFYTNRSRLPKVQDNRTWGYFMRKPAHMLKLAMLLSVAKRNDRVLSLDDVLQSKALLETYVEPSMKRAFTAVGNNPYATDFERINDQIEMSGGIGFQELVDSNYHNLDQRKLEMTIQALVAAGRVVKDVSTMPPVFKTTQQFAAELAHKSLNGGA